MAGKTIKVITHLEIEKRKSHKTVWVDELGTKRTVGSQKGHCKKASLFSLQNIPHNMRTRWQKRKKFHSVVKISMFCPTKFEVNISDCSTRLTDLWMFYVSTQSLIKRSTHPLKMVPWMERQVKFYIKVLEVP